METSITPKIAQSNPFMLVRTASFRRQFASCQNFVCLHVFLAGFVGNIVRQRRRRRRLIPRDGAQTRAGTLVLIRLLRWAGLVVVGGRDMGRIMSRNLV